MRLSRPSSGFSLIELLVALSILAVVAAVIVPRFLNVRSQAAATVLAAQLAQLNHTYNQWTSLGGTTDANATGIMIVQFLSAVSDGTANRSLANNHCTDTLGNFGSSTISLSTYVQNTNVGPQSSSDTDGFYKKTGGGAAPPTDLFLKLSGSVYPILYTSGSGFSQDSNGTVGSL